MNISICVKLPEVIYLSPDPDRDYPQDFYMAVSYGFISKNQEYVKETASEKAAVEEIVDGETAGKASVILNGIEGLTGESYLQDFVDNLSISDDDWSVKKSSTGNSIIFYYTGTGLAEDFKVDIKETSFICRAERNGTYPVKVSVRNFSGVEDASYIVKVRAAYTPWAKSLTPEKCRVPVGTDVSVAYEYDGDGVDKELYCNGVKVNTSSSPYEAKIERQSLFTLRVFNQNGITDTAQAVVEVDKPVVKSFVADKQCFSKGEEIHLKWEVSSAVSWYLADNQGSRDMTGECGCTVKPEPSIGSCIVQYTLTANGYKGNAPDFDQRTVSLTQSEWKKMGALTGFLAGDVYGDTAYNSRLFRYNKNWYCYRHPVLYQSQGGLAWKEYSTNTEAGDGFVCIAADFHDRILYVMGRPSQEGQQDKLKVAWYDFVNSKWNYEAAGQICSADKGCFAFSDDEERYAQILPAGIMTVGHGEDGWNEQSDVAAAPDGCSIVNGDYCFYKDSFYVSMLCDDQRLYVYQCSSTGYKEVLCMDTVSTDSFTSLVPVRNKLYVCTDSALYDVMTQKTVDYYYPGSDKNPGRPWFGRNDRELWGCFPDKNLWVLP